jgi:hypothetical protein
MSLVVGYEFQVREPGPRHQPNRWVRLQGSGGCFGDGSLHIEEPNVEQITRSLLGQARRELRTEGILREWRDHENHLLRIQPLDALHVLRCRAIFRKK